MTIDDLIRIAAERSPRTEEVEAAAGYAQLTIVQLYDAFAKTVATRYLRGDLSYTDGDAAMNGLFAYAFPGGSPEFDALALCGSMPSEGAIDPRSSEFVPIRMGYQSPQAIGQVTSMYV